MSKACGLSKFTKLYRRQTGLRNARQFCLDTYFANGRLTQHRLDKPWFSVYRCVHTVIVTVLIADSLRATQRRQSRCLSYTVSLPSELLVAMKELLSLSSQMKADYNNVK